MACLAGIRYTYHQRRQAIAVARNILDRFERDDRELAIRARDALPDGYANHSGAVGITITAGVSDPVLRAALRRAAAEPDPASRALTLLLEGVRLLTLGDSARAEAFPPTNGAARTDQWCTSCTRAQIDGKPVLSPRGDPKAVGKGSTLCGWCHSFNREHGQLPPTPLIRMRARGERIYERDVRQYLG
jgi:hypothetical protein